jgi:hypothetical protein
MVAAPVRIRDERVRIIALSSDRERLAVDRTHTL